MSQPTYEQYMALLIKKVQTQLPLGSQQAVTFENFEKLIKISEHPDFIWPIIRYHFPDDRIQIAFKVNNKDVLIETDKKMTEIFTITSTVISPEYFEEHETYSKNINEEEFYVFYQELIDDLAAYDIDWKQNAYEYVLTWDNEEPYIENLKTIITSHQVYGYTDAVFCRNCDAEFFGDEETYDADFIEGICPNNNKEPWEHTHRQKQYLQSKGKENE